MVRSKNISPSWSDVKTALLDFDRAGLRGLVQTSTLPAKTTRHSCMPAWAWVGSAPALQSEYFQMDIAGPNERPTHIGF